MTTTLERELSGRSPRLVDISAPSSMNCLHRQRPRIMQFGCGQEWTSAWFSQRSGGLIRHHLRLGSSVVRLGVQSLVKFLLFLATTCYDDLIVFPFKCQCRK